MTCEQLSDKMPAVAGGTAAWSAEEAEHLRTCADCLAEWTVVEAGLTAGAGGSVDADALAARVLHRLRTEPAVAPRVRPRWLVGLAAAAIIVFLLVPRNTTTPLPPTPAAPLAVDVPGLGSLDAEDLADVLDAFDPSWTETSTTDAPSLDDLDPQELERIGRTWEI